MSDLNKLFTRIPKRVHALQWLPYSLLPNVENKFIDVTLPQENKPFSPDDIINGSDVSNYFNTMAKPTKICISATATMVNGERQPVEPTNWVIYSETTKLPIAIMTTENFTDLYIDSDKFDLCPTCFANSAVFKKDAPNFKSAAEAVALIQAGHGVMVDGVKFNTFEELTAWAKEKGISV